MAEKKTFKPDFIIIPTQLIECENLNWTERAVYGAIYLFSSLGDKRCFASNNAIAGIIKSTSGTVANALLKLEKEGFVSRTFNDLGERESIIPLVSYDRASQGSEVPPHKEVNPPSHGSEHINNIYKEEDIKIGAIPLQGTTPAQRVYNFYSLVFRHFYGFAPKGAYIKDLSVIKSLLKDYTELQLAMFILLHFEWKGANGNDDFVYKRLSGACFPLSWIKPNTNAYQAFFKHTLQIDLDDTDTILATVTEKVDEYK